MLQSLPLPQNTVLHLATQLVVDLEGTDSQLHLPLLLRVHQVGEHLVRRTALQRRVALALADTTMRDALVKVALLAVRIEVNLIRLIYLLTALADTVLLASDGG